MLILSKLLFLSYYVLFSIASIIQLRAPFKTNKEASASKKESDAFVLSFNSLEA